MWASAESWRSDPPFCRLGPPSPFHCTDLSPFPSLPRRELLAFSHICFLLLFHDHTREEKRSSRSWASQSQPHPQVCHGKDLDELQPEIHTTWKGMWEASASQSSSTSHPPFITMEGGNFDQANRMIIFFEQYLNSIQQIVC